MTFVKKFLDKCHRFLATSSINFAATKFQYDEKTFGIIGAGNIAQTVATFLINTGHEVTLSNTNADKLSEVISTLGTGAKGGLVPEAAAADIVILALP